VAEATYYTSFGFNNVNEQLKRLEEKMSRRIDEELKSMHGEVDVGRLADEVTARLRPTMQSSSNQLAEIALGISIVAVAAAVAGILLSRRKT
jgi:hypothetical protein